MSGMLTPLFLSSCSTSTFFAGAGGRSKKSLICLYSSTRVFRSPFTNSVNWASVTSLASTAGGISPSAACRASVVRAFAHAVLRYCWNSGFRFRTSDVRKALKSPSVCPASHGPLNFHLVSSFPRLPPSDSAIESRSLSKTLLTSPALKSPRFVSGMAVVRGTPISCHFCKVIE